MIAPRIANLRALDYPPERMEVIVACDGSPDDNASRARGAGADVVLELPRGGKIRAQDAGVERARGELIAFSDANAAWEPDALRRLIAAFADPSVGYACGQVRFVDERGTNQEGVYWRYEMAIGARITGSLGDRRQRCDLRHSTRLIHRRRPDHGPRPVVPLQHGQAGLARRCT